MVELEASAAAVMPSVPVCHGSRDTATRRRARTDGLPAPPQIRSPIPEGKGAVSERLAGGTRIKNNLPEGQTTPF